MSRATQRVMVISFIVTLIAGFQSVAESLEGHPITGWTLLAVVGSIVYIASIVVAELEEDPWQ